jgi:hypothetical protein
MKEIINGFYKGMGSLSLFHPKLPKSTPWQGVAQSFYRTGKNMQSAMKQVYEQYKQAR